MRPMQAISALTKIPMVSCFLFLHEFHVNAMISSLPFSSVSSSTVRSASWNPCGDEVRREWGIVGGGICHFSPLCGVKDA